MSRPAKLYRTTLVIWSEFDPQHVDNADLGRESDEGAAWCEQRTTIAVLDPEEFPATDFFIQDD